MDIYEVQDMIAKQFPDKKVSLELDSNCQRFIEIVLTDSNPNVIHHVEHNKVKVNVEGMPSYYLPILPHRMNYTWTAVQEMLSSKNDVFIHSNDLDHMRNNAPDSQEYQDKLNQLIDFTGLTKENIEQKL